MKITQSLNRDLAYPLGGVVLAIIGIVYAICGLFVLIIRQVCNPRVFLFVSVVLLVTSINLLSFWKNVEWSGRTAEVALITIILFGVSTVVESSIDRRRRKNIKMNKRR